MLFLLMSLLHQIVPTLGSTASQALGRDPISAPLWPPVFALFLSPCLHLLQQVCLCVPWVLRVCSLPNRRLMAVFVRCCHVFLDQVHPSLCWLGFEKDRGKNPMLGRYEKAHLQLKLPSSSSQHDRDHGRDHGRGLGPGPSTV